MSFARYQDGERLEPHIVSVVWSHHGLSIQTAQSGSLLTFWPYADIREISAPGGGEELRLSLGHGQGPRLILSNPSDCIEARRRCSELKEKQGLEPGWWKGYAVWGSGAILSVVIIFQLIIPTLSTQLVVFIPMSWEQKLGSQVEESILYGLSKIEDKDEASMICKGTEGQQALERLIAQFKSADPDLDQYQIKVIDTDMANAFALPGKRILILRGLLDKAVKLKQGPNGVVGVLAHEIGHVKERHAMVNLIQQTASSAILGLVLGDVTGGAIIVGSGEMALNAAYSRDKERAADTYALELMNKAAFDPTELAELLDALTNGEGSDENNEDQLHGETTAWFSSHPATLERSKLIEAQSGIGTDAMRTSEWKSLTAICDR